VREEAAYSLGLAFPYVLNKNQAWSDIRRLTQDKEEYVRRETANALGLAFSYFHDKEQAWSDLIEFTKDPKREVRMAVAKAISLAYSDAHDKEKVYADLHQLSHNEEIYVRRIVAYALGPTYPHVPDKEKAYADIQRLIQDNDGNVRRRATRSLSKIFFQAPDKEQAWTDLHGFIVAEEKQVRRIVANVLGSSFYQVPDKMQAMEDLLKLTKDKEEFVRWHAADAVGTSFFHFPDKERGWSYLRRLMLDEDSVVVRRNAAKAIGLAFSHIPDKEQAWFDLYRLTLYDDEFVLESANYSLGQASIFMATEADNEEEFKEEIGNAIDFFARSLDGETYFNPSSFCLPFYRSFYKIAFEKTKSEDEVQRYISEAKRALEGSKNKETLLEAVENLASALTEAHKTRDFDAIKSDLNAYRQYCDRAADLISDVNEGAPGAALVLRRGLPIIDERIKEIIREIQEKARAACRETQGTPLEELGLVTAISAQELPTQDPLALMMNLNNMASSATKNWCEYLPTDKKVDACEQLKNLADMEILEQGEVIATVFEYVQKNIYIPKIQTVHISETEHEIVRIAVAQFCFEMTESFPFVLKNLDVVKT